MVMLVYNAVVVVAG